MTRSDHYMYVQGNLELLEKQISMVKKMAQSSIGKCAWQEENSNDINQINSSKQEVLAATRLYTFLICSWLEVRISKVFYENSSCAFTDSEINTIIYVNNNKKRTMENIWKLSFSLALQKSYGFSAQTSPDFDYSSEFISGSLALENYQKIRVLFDDISGAITVRNRLAHGQWKTQFNSKNTSVEQYPLMIKYNDIQKLEHLKDYFNIIGEIISMYVTYKDKQNPNFDNIVARKLQLIQDKKSKIENMKYSKYVSSLKKVYEKNRLRRKEIFK